jgi:uncharacterized protein YndB with AHSA1/START domain
MPHEFEVREEIELDATPEQVWEAITAGPGIDSWFMGRNEIEPRVGGTARTALPGFTMEATVTAWEPGRRAAWRGEESPDGAFMAFEYLVEARRGGTSVLRFVHNGFLGDDWEAEYEALKVGDRMYLEMLARYLRHFRGRTATANVFLPGPVTDTERAYAAFGAALGLPRPARDGDAVRLSVDGLPATEGVVEFATPTSVGARTSDSLLLFQHGYQDTVVVQQHSFAPAADEKEIERAWQGWLERSFG